MRGDVRPDFAILNSDDEFFGLWSSLAEDFSVLSFGLGEAADIRADNIVAEGNQSRFRLILPGTELKVVLPLVGIHNIRNACAAAAVATVLGVPAAKIAIALQSVRPVAGRLQALNGIKGATLYDDTYNANPLSVIAAADFIASLPGQSLLVLGDMGELGPGAPSLHREVGDAVLSAGVDRLFATGDLSKNTVDAFGNNATWFASVESLIDAAAEHMGADVNVLVKGSRFMRMERVVTELSASHEMRREA